MSEFTYKELIDEIPKLAAINAANNAIIRNLEIKLDQYEKGFKGACPTCEVVGEVNGQLVSQLNKAIEALEFYANKDNWLVTDWDADTIANEDCDDSIAGHGGKRARQYLEKYKGELC